MADQLAALGTPVPDKILVLNVLRGLNGCFAHLASLITRQRPFPLFRVVRADLDLEEINMLGKPNSSSQALAASTSRSTNQGSSDGNQGSNQAGNQGGNQGTAANVRVAPAVAILGMAARAVPRRVLQAAVMPRGLARLRAPRLVQ